MSNELNSWTKMLHNHSKDEIAPWDLLITRMTRVAANLRDKTIDLNAQIDLLDVSEDASTAQLDRLTTDLKELAPDFNSVNAWIDKLRDLTLQLPKFDADAVGLDLDDLEQDIII
jgi:hypothetical protein